MTSTKPNPVNVYMWPKGEPLPPGARDGMADFLEGDDEFKHGPEASYRPRGPEGADDV